ncbi:MAG: hypothetical protein V3T53_07435 [Phycisphaerales bacterium]
MTEQQLMTIGLIAICPLCDYDLKGLPTEHKCPECGYEYDNATIVLRCWTSKGKRTSWLARLFLPSIVGLGILALLLLGGLPTLPPLVLFLGLPIYLAFLILIAYYVAKILVRRKGKPDAVVAISAVGLGIRANLDEPGSIASWNEYESVKIRRAGRELHALMLYRRRGTGRGPVPLYLLFESQRVDKQILQREMEHHIKAARSKDEPLTPDA